MRYDGYYVLSDLLNRPNLSLSARRELHQFGRTIISKSWLSRDWMLIVYGLLAASYRWVVMSALMVAIICFTNDNSILVVGWLLAAGMLLLLVRGLIKSNRGSQLSTRSDNALSAVLSKSAFAIAVAGLVWFVCFVPLPRWVYVDVQVQPVKAQTLFATSDGLVDAADMRSGDVSAGQIILTLNNSELSHQYLEAEIEANRAVNQIEQLQRQARQLPELNETLAAVTEQAKAKRVRLEQLRSQLQDLSLIHI